MARKASTRHKNAVKNYLTGGPTVRGKWDASCRMAGFQRVPSKDSKEFENAFHLVREGGEDVPQEEIALTDLLDFNEASGWEEAGPIARAMLAKIGAGLVEANQGQVTALKEIIARSEGKIGMDTQKERPLGIVVLPALGSLSEGMVDAPPVGEPMLKERHFKGVHRQMEAVHD